MLINENNHSLAFQKYIFFLNWYENIPVHMAFYELRAEQV